MMTTSDASTLRWPSSSASPTDTCRRLTIYGVRGLEGYSVNIVLVFVGRGPPTLKGVHTGPAVQGCEANCSRDRDNHLPVGAALPGNAGNWRDG